MLVLRSVSELSFDIESLISSEVILEEFTSIAASFSNSYEIFSLSESGEEA